MSAAPRLACKGQTEWEAQRQTDLPFFYPVSGNGEGKEVFLLSLVTPFPTFDGAHLCCAWTVMIWDWVGNAPTGSHV